MPIDYTGEIFGPWIAERPTETRSSDGSIVWHFSHEDGQGTLETVPSRLRNYWTSNQNTTTLRRNSSENPPVQNIESRAMNDLTENDKKVILALFDPTNQYYRRSASALSRLTGLTEEEVNEVALAHRDIITTKTNDGNKSYEIHRTIRRGFYNPSRRVDTVTNFVNYPHNFINIFKQIIVGLLLENIRETENEDRLFDLTDENLKIIRLATFCNVGTITSQSIARQLDCSLGEALQKLENLWCFRSCEDHINGLNFSLRIHNDILGQVAILSKMLG